MWRVDLISTSVVRSIQSRDITAILAQCSSSVPQSPPGPFARDVQAGHGIRAEPPEGGSPSPEGGSPPPSPEGQGPSDDGVAVHKIA